MFQFFDAIVSVFTTIVNFIVSTVEMILHLIRIIFGGIGFLFALIPNLPSFCETFLLVTIAVSVLIQLLNKGG